MSIYEQINLQAPARYRIVVRGQWTTAIGDLRATPLPGPIALTSLEGVVRDQADLHGCLRAIYGLGLALISLTLLESEEEHD